MFRTTARSLVAPLVRPVRHLDLNADWRLDGQPLLVRNTSAIRRKIANVLITLVGEEPFEPTFGSLITHRVFENITRRTSYLAEGDTVEALSRCMAGEITVFHQQCAIVPLYEDDGYYIELVYEEIGTGTVDTWAFDVTRHQLGG